MKKQTTNFFERLIYNEAGAIETMLFGLGIAVAAFLILWVINPNILHLR